MATQADINEEIVTEGDISPVEIEIAYLEDYLAQAAVLLQNIDLIIVQVRGQALCLTEPHSQLNKTGIARHPVKGM